MRDPVDMLDTDLVPAAGQRKNWAGAPEVGTPETRSQPRLHEELAVVSSLAGPAGGRCLSLRDPGSRPSPTRQPGGDQAASRPAMGRDAQVPIGTPHTHTLGSAGSLLGTRSRASPRSGPPIEP